MKKRVASDSALEHALEGSKIWELHHLQNDYMSKSGTVQLVPLLLPKFEKEKFKSDNSKLRGGFGDAWGYFVAPLIPRPVIPADKILTANQEEEKKPTENPSEQKKAKSDKPAVRGRPRKRKIPIRVPIPGDPDLDAGAEMLVPILQTGLSLTLGWRRMRTAKRLLNDYDKEMTTKVKGVIRKYCRQHLARADSSPSQQTLLERMTVDLMPGFSRAIERMLADRGQLATRKLLEAATPLILAEYQKLFPAARVVGAAWHVRSGQLHLDIWSHSTRLEVVQHGKGTALARLWNATGLAHYGPGSGICAWDRHARALGDQAEAVAPGLVEVVKQALDRQVKTHGNKANRDVDLHRAVDNIFADLLPQPFQDVGMGEYRTWLHQQYSLGLTGPVARRPKSQKAIYAEIKAKAFLDGLQKISGLFENITNPDEPVDADAVKTRFEEWITTIVETEKTKGKQAGLETVRELIEQAQADREETAKMLEKVRDIMDTAEFEGLKNARRAFLREAAREPLATTATDLVTEFKEEIEAVVDSAIKAREGTFADRDAKLDIRESALKTLEDKAADQKIVLANKASELATRLTDVGVREDKALKKENEFAGRESQIEVRQSALETREANAVINGLRTAYRVLNSGREPTKTTQAGILGEITTSITKTVADMVMGVVGRLRPNFKSTATTLVELDGEIQEIQQEAVERKIALDNLTIDIETDRKRMSRIPVRELCETLGLVVDKDDLISGSLESFNVPGVEFEYRGSIKGESFELEVFHHHHKGHGQHAWVKLRPGNGAIDFLCSLMPKPDFVLACKRLAAIFPDREGGILLGHVTNKGGNLWNNVFPIPQPETPAPQKTADPKIEEATTTKEDIET